MRPEGKYSIWYFIGILLLVYGVLIFATGIYEVYRPPAREVVLANLRPAIWWGALLAVVGALYTIRFSPSRVRPTAAVDEPSGHEIERDRKDSKVLPRS